MNYITTYSDFMLNETLKTHDINLTFNNVNRELSLLRINFNININLNKIEITLLGFRFLKDIKSYLDLLNNLLIDRHGWFPSEMEITNISNMKNILPYDEEALLDNKNNIYYQDVKITYEAKYDKLVDIPDKLYHLSIQHYENSVLKNGLIPKSKSKLSKHLDRIYLCSDPKDCYNLIGKMNFLYTVNKFSKSKNNINTKWIIYEIDTNDLDFKLYQDPNYTNSTAAYTTDNINRDNITIFNKEK
jgi:hypothetical protein